MKIKEYKELDIRPDHNWTNKIFDDEIEYHHDKIAQLQNEIERHHTAMDETFMDTYIKPFCQKYGLSFKSYNGTFIFLTRQSVIVDADIRGRDRVNTTFWDGFRTLCKGIELIDCETKFMGGGYWFENDNMISETQFDDCKHKGVFTR